MQPLYTFENYEQLCAIEKRTCGQEIIFYTYQNIMHCIEFNNVFKICCDKHASILNLFKNKNCTEEGIDEMEDVFKGIAYSFLANVCYINKDYTESLKYCEKSLALGNNKCLLMVMALQKNNITNQCILDLVEGRIKPRNVSEFIIIAKINDRNSKYFMKRDENQEKIALRYYKKALDYWCNDLDLIADIAKISWKLNWIKRLAFPGKHTWLVSKYCGKTKKIEAPFTKEGVIMLGVYYFHNNNFAKAFELLKNYNHLLIVKRMHVKYYLKHDPVKAVEIIETIKHETDEFEYQLFRYYEITKQYDKAFEMLNEHDRNLRFHHYRITWRPEWHQYFANPVLDRTIVTILITLKHRRYSQFPMFCKLIAMNIIKFLPL